MILGPNDQPDLAADIDLSRHTFLRLAPDTEEGERGAKFVEIEILRHHTIYRELMYQLNATQRIIQMLGSRWLNAIQCGEA